MHLDFLLTGSRHRGRLLNAPPQAPALVSLVMDGLNQLLVDCFEIGLVSTPPADMSIFSTFITEYLSSGYLGLSFHHSRLGGWVVVWHC